MNIVRLFKNYEGILYTLHAREDYRQLSLLVKDDTFSFLPNYKNT